MPSKNIETELQELRYKVRLLKETNKFENKSSKIDKGLLDSERNINEKISIDGKITKNKCETWQFTFDEEALIVTSCYRKSIELVKKHAREKKKKHKINNSVDNIIDICNENIYTNCTAELSYTPSSVNECDFNNSHKSEKCDSNNFASECEVANPHVQSMICDNFEQKRKETFQSIEEKNLSAITTKQTVYRNLQNDSAVQTTKINMNVEADVLFLKTGTHSRKKRNDKSTGRNEIYSETFSGSDKVNNTNTKQKICDLALKHPEIEQKETDNPGILYRNTENVSPSIMALKDNNSLQINNNSERINATNFTRNNALQKNHFSLFHNKCDSVPSFQDAKKITAENSQHNENWLSSRLKTSDCLINLSSEEDEPEIIVPEWDFTEEPVDFTVPPLHIDESSDCLSQQKIDLLESKGIFINKGRWSEKETALLIRNYKDFVDRFGISDARLLLGIGRKNSNKYDYKNVRKFLKAKHFLVRLGKDINRRSLHYIYMKGRQMFNPLRYERKNGINDIPFLFQLQRKYGNQWELIAKKFGRSASYCEFLYRENKECYNKGKWSNEEIENLIFAVKKVSKSSDIFSQHLKNISWKKVSKFVKTRSPHQCQIRWKLKQKLKIIS